MNLFGRKKIKRIPNGFSAADIKIESSICTGEKTIGFYNRQTDQLIYAELVRNNSDIAAFYDKYGLERTD